MRNLGRHRVQLINPFDAAATLLQAAVRRLFAIINMPPEMIFDVIFDVGGINALLRAFYVHSMYVVTSWG